MEKEPIMEQSMPCYEQTGSILDTCQASKILNSIFYGASGFSFHCRKIMPNSKTRDLLILRLT